MNFIVEFFTKNFENCIWLATILIAMCPTLESKIAIPFAMNTALWGAKAISPLLAFFLAFIGSIIPSFFIMIFSRKIKNKSTGFISSSFFNKYANKSTLINNRNNLVKKYAALTGFVSVPIPLTGVWTGSLIAGFSNLNLFYSAYSISMGALISAGITTLICTVFKNAISYILICSIVIIIIFLICELIFGRIKQKNTD